MSGTPDTAGSAEGLLSATEGEGEDDMGMLTEGKRGHSVSVELRVGAGRWPEEVKGDLFKLEQD